MQNKKVHFICRGNTYRSRLAEAYFRKLDLPGYVVSSSGIDGAEDPEIQMEWYTYRLASGHGLKSLLSKRKVQTSETLLQENDILVFMNKDVYEDACKQWPVDARKSVVWHVQDIDERLHFAGATKRNKQLVRELSEDTFDKISHDCDKLAKYLMDTSWADIVDVSNQPTRIRLPVAWANDRGLWRRGVHIILSTPDKKYLVEQRSKTIIFAPSCLDISLGGAVDSGETVKQAAVRETKEELGITVHPQELQLLEVRRWSTYHPHYRKYSRCFVYTYHAVMDLDSLTIRIQESEVARAMMLSRHRLNLLLRTHRLRHIGKLNSGYKYYRRIVKLSQASK